MGIKMNISKKNFSELKNYIKSFQEKNETELEAIIWGDSFKNLSIFHNNFISVINYFKDTLSIEPERKYCLAIKTFSSNVRSSVQGLDNIKEYWLRDNIEELDVEYIRKENKNRFELSDYGIRLNYNDEKIIDKETKVTNINRIKDEDEKKFFRYKDTISFRHNKFRIDCSTVKQCSGKKFRGSGCLKAISTFEIEIELIEKTGDNTEVANEFLEIIANIVTLLQKSVDLISVTEAEEVVKEYKKLVKISSKNSRSHFIAVNPVSLGVDNLLPSSTIINILNDYAVTYKAD